jgi:hypothetical protein
MADRVIAKIWIGGTLRAANAQVLIDAINEAQVYPEEGDIHFQPCSAVDLMEARTTDGLLYLCDDEAPWGEMDSMIEVCGRLGLSYRHWHEASSDGGAAVTWWAPGMDQPISYPSDHFDQDRIFVDVGVVRSTLDLLRTGQVGDAVALLEGALPVMPSLPPFEIVGASGDGPTKSTTVSASSPPRSRGSK